MENINNIASDMVRYGAGQNLAASLEPLGTALAGIGLAETVAADYASLSNAISGGTQVFPAPAGLNRVPRSFDRTSADT